jgi:hypothetical protein
VTRRPIRPTPEALNPLARDRQEKSRQQSLLSAGEYHLVATEREWQSFVIDFARMHGWWVYHPLRSKGSEAGWPDLTLIRPPRTVFAELKREGGQLSPAQRLVLQMLEACHHEVYVWRPSDRDLVIKKLT